MFKSLLLLLTISVVYNEGFQYKERRSVEAIVSKDFKESTAQLINKLVNLLRNGLEQGKDSFEKVINDEDVKAILERLSPLSRKIANSIIQGFKDILDKIDSATKTQSEKTERGIKESSAQLINKLVTLLKDALDQGREVFDKVVNDEDVKAILDHLSPLSRKIANSIIQGFKDLLDKIDNATKDKPQLYKRNLKETSASLINKLMVLLKKAFDQGLETYKKVINDEDVKAILDHLGPLSRKVAESIIKGFQNILERVDKATNDQPQVYKIDIKETSKQLIQKLVHLLKEAFEQGRDEFEKVINDKDVQGILEHLGPLSRKFVQTIINGFYDLLDKIDFATKLDATF